MDSSVSPPFDRRESNPSRFSSAAKLTFADAWGKQPRHSRLMHGVGIVSLGFLMDAITDRRRASGQVVLSTSDYRDELSSLKEACRWTNGYWPFGPQTQRRW